MYRLVMVRIYGILRLWSYTMMVQVWDLVLLVVEVLE